MRLTGSELVRRQWTVRTLLRIGALALIAWASIQIVANVVTWLAMLQFMPFWYGLATLGSSALLIAAGGCVLKWSHRLATWSTRGLDISACPACGYDTDGHAICPECGIDLSAPVRAGGSPGSPASAVWMLAVVGRAVGAFLVLRTILQLPIGVLVYSGLTASEAESWLYLTRVGAGGVAGLVLLTWSSGIATRVVASTRLPAPAPADDRSIGTGES